MVLTSGGGRRAGRGAGQLVWPALVETPGGGRCRRRAGASAARRPGHWPSPPAPWPLPGPPPAQKGELGDWFAASWGFAKQILPLLLFGVLVAGLLLGRPGTKVSSPRAGSPPPWAATSLWANLFAAVSGAFMYFATLTEVPILEGLLGSGMGRGPALSLLLAGPAVSLPSILVMRSIMGGKRTAVFIDPGRRPVGRDRNHLRSARYRWKETPMDIAILGTGCPKCHKLADETKKAVDELGLDCEVSKVTEVADIMKYGVMMTPALVVDGEVKVVGKVPSRG